jgi:hypothetical protein
MKTAGDTWERRWITRLPSRFEAGALSATLGAPSSAIHECDAYLLTESARINLKVRRRGSRPKLKILHGRADDQREH